MRILKGNLIFKHIFERSLNSFMFYRIMKILWELMANYWRHEDMKLKQKFNFNDSS